MFPLYDENYHTRIPFITYGLIAITCYVFFLQLTSPTGLLQYALTPDKVNLGNIHTLLPFFTSIFLHGGFMHIITNMWFLKVFGDNIEDALGHIPYLFLYFLSGILGSLTQFLFAVGSNVPMLGASGAIAGVLGAYFILFPRNKVKTFIPVIFPFFILDVPAIIMLGYWFILQIFSGVGSLGTSPDQGGVAFFAHIAGFITGIIFAKLFGKNTIETDVYKEQLA